MCRQFYVGCRHLSCHNILRTLHREPCGQYRCEGVTYCRWKKWRSATGSRYCRACEEMGPEEWALLRRARNREKAKRRLQEQAAIKRQAREEKVRSERLQRAEEKAKNQKGPKKPRRPYKARKKSVRLPPLESLWSAGPNPDWGNSFFGTPPPPPPDPPPPQAPANVCRCSLCVPQSAPTTQA